MVAVNLIKLNRHYLRVQIDTFCHIIIVVFVYLYNFVQFRLVKYQDIPTTIIGCAAQ